MSFTLAKQLRDGGKLFAAWISSGSPRNAEMVAAAGFDTVIFDVQHGEASLAELRDGISAVRMRGKPSGFRAGLDELGNAARALDFGAELLIMPMVNTAEDASALVQASKYPPLGGRSWGPTRALNVLGSSAEEYREQANHNIIVLPMIETRQALENASAILDVPGIDGVFIGPSDLSISLSDGKTLDHNSPDVVQAIRHILSLAKSRSKLSAIFCANGEAAARNAVMGFDILAIASDLGFLTHGAKAALTAAKSAVG